MKRVLLFGCSLAFGAIILSSLIGDLDNFRLSHTGYRLIPSSYAAQVGLVYVDDDSLIISQHVVDYELSGDYLMVLRMVSESLECNELDETGAAAKTLLTHYSDKQEFFLINYVSNKVSGPYNKNEFLEVLAKYNLSEMGLSVPENYYVNSGIFKEKISKCDSVEEL